MSAVPLLFVVAWVALGITACGSGGEASAPTGEGQLSGMGPLVEGQGRPPGAPPPLTGTEVAGIDEVFVVADDGMGSSAGSPAEGGSLIGLPPGVPAAPDTMAIPAMASAGDATPGPVATPPGSTPQSAGQQSATDPAPVPLAGDASGAAPVMMDSEDAATMADATTNQADILFSEDFEGGTVGQTPAGWDTFIAWNANAGNNPQGNVFALVADDQPHAGAQVLHVSGGGNPAQLTRPLPEGTTRLHVRAYVRMTRQLGQNPGANHETLFAIRGIPGAAHDEVRFGEIKGVIGTNEVPSDNIAPRYESWGKGPVVPANTWACIEVAFIADQTPHQLRAWVDGELVHEVTDPSQDFQNGPLSETWLSGHFKEVVIGWHSFSGQDAEVWIDDVVVSRSAIGC